MQFFSSQFGGKSWRSNIASHYYMQALLIIFIFV